MEKRNLYSSEELANEIMTFVADDICHICAKKLLDTNLNQTVIHKVLNVIMKLLQISHIHKHRSIIMYNWNFVDRLLFPYKFDGNDI